MVTMMLWCGIEEKIKEETKQDYNDKE